MSINGSTLHASDGKAVDGRGGYPQRRITQQVLSDTIAILTMPKLS